MNPDHIRERLRIGFKPFEIHLTNGRKFAVPHPEFLIVGRNVVAVLGKNDVVTTIDALHIATVEDLPAKRKGS